LAALAEPDSLANIPRCSANNFLSLTLTHFFAGYNRILIFGRHIQSVSIFSTVSNEPRFDSGRPYLFGV